MLPRCFEGLAALLPSEVGRPAGDPAVNLAISTTGNQSSRSPSAAER